MTIFGVYLVGYMYANLSQKFDLPPPLWWPAIKPLLVCWTRDNFGAGYTKMTWVNTLSHTCPSEGKSFAGLDNLVFLSFERKVALLLDHGSVSHWLSLLIVKF